MRKIVLSAALTLLCFAMHAQLQRGVKGGYDVTRFPEVAFVWNSPNPELMNAARFSLTENEKPLDFTVREITTGENKSYKKSVLVLWEDMASHSHQSDFSRTLLSRFFSEASLNSEDRFNVAVFNRKHDSRQYVLAPLLNSFTSDGGKLASEVAAYKKSGDFFSSFPMQSDLYMAINEGIDVLRKESSDRVGVVIVVTAGLNIKAAGASTEMETVRQNAIKAGIPIYVVKYPVSGNTPEVNTLSESTFGLVFSGMDPDEALVALNGFYDQFDRRLYGRDYKLTFTTENQRDGKVHPIRLTVDKVAQPIPPYVAPNQTFWMWIKSHILLVLFLLAALIGGSVTAILLLKKNKEKRQRHDEELRMQLEQQQESMQQAQRGFNATIEKLRSEQESDKLIRQRQLEEDAKEREEERLTRLMQTKNLHPRLKCQIGNDGFNYTVGKIRTTLGRNSDNDVAFTKSNNYFNNLTVSGYHAEIVFNGTSFELVNISSTYAQGIVVNGQLYQRCTLRSGDTFGLGEAAITFYV